MEEKEDLRKHILPSILYDTQAKLRDLLFIPKENTCLKWDESIRKAGYSTSALIQDTTVGGNRLKNKYKQDVLGNKTTVKGEKTENYYLRTPTEWGGVRKMGDDGFIHDESVDEQHNVGVRVSLFYEIPEHKVYIGTTKDEYGKEKYHTIYIGEGPGEEIVGKGAETLEALYNSGNVKEDLIPTGRWYSSNGGKRYDIGYQGKHSPEFEYKGVPYVRTMSDPKTNHYQYTEGSKELTEGRVRWQAVDPIKFIILNWDNLPKTINPNGLGIDDYLELLSEDIVISNLPFYPMRDENGNLYQNSTIRGFLNGIDVRDITENGNPEYSASNGGDFRGECNWLNETFNLSRKPMIEYVIPESEEEIPDDGFNGCVTLKKLTLHKDIQHIGDRAFNGIDFRYAYKTPTGEIMFSKELLKDLDESIEPIELEQLRKALPGLDYNLFLKDNQMNDIINLSERLNKQHFSIPYVYGAKLLENGLASSFCEKSDFKFFRTENPKIVEMLSQYPEEERLSFFKFATALGCFSKEKMLDENGKETQTMVAQKASVAMASMLKGILPLRSVS